MGATRPRLGVEALVILEGLAAELGIVHTPIVVARRIQRDVVADIYQKIAALGTAKLREAAASLWADFFGRELPVLELIAHRALSRSIIGDRGGSPTLP